MLLNKKGGFQLLPNVEDPKYIVFCDFDETYYPHFMTEERQKDLYELENYLEVKSNDGELVFGWVTGSSIESILHKMEHGKFRFFPHFIASDLGTEITYFSEKNFLEQDPDWNSQINIEEFNKIKVDEIINVLHKGNIPLTPQTQLGSSRYKRNYYYQIQHESVDNKNLSTIESMAKEYGIGVNINRCNPLAGDPEDSYDVDFIPLGTGKNEIVRFMLDKFGLTREHAFAFGDSGNDLLMLKSVNYGYLVGNATQEAKEAHSQIATDMYSKGIIRTLQSIINNRGEV
ncbi:HAD-IIB family hydrolase [Peribacillus simplex]|uniref:HAD-IIB family hydrolase n=1 Tax=Peribacillus simplex TaxID=1478 RepID=UPI003D26B8A4